MATLVQMTRLDDFQPTDVSRKAFADLYLEQHGWAALTKDRATRAANIRVSADDGRVLITGVAPNTRCHQRHRGSGIRALGGRADARRSCGCRGSLGW